MAGFKCPFCGEFMSINNGTQMTYRLNFDGNYTQYTGPLQMPYLKISIYRCPNDACQKETVDAKGLNGYINGHQVPIYPEMVYRHFPEYVPEAVRNDYEEACMIQERSPKAAATLARRCLQGMIRDFWSVTGKRSLFEEIDAIKDKVPAAQWMAIDAVRKIGNIGAHMEKDVDLIIDVEPEEAEKLLKLIELLMEKWYIARRDEEALYKAITETGDAKTAAKHPAP